MRRVILPRSGLKTVNKPKPISKVTKIMKRNARTVLVTGAAGYIGSVLVPELLARDFTVIAAHYFTKDPASLPCFHRTLFS